MKCFCLSVWSLLEVSLFTFPPLHLIFGWPGLQSWTSSFTFQGPCRVCLHVLGHLPSWVTHMSFPFHFLSFLMVQAFLPSMGRCLFPWNYTSLMILWPQGMSTVYRSSPDSEMQHWKDPESRVDLECFMAAEVRPRGFANSASLTDSVTSTRYSVTEPTLSAEEEIGILLGLKKVCPVTPFHGVHYLESTRWALVVFYDELSVYQIIYNLVSCYPSQLKLFLTQSPIFTHSPSLKPLCRCLLKPYWPLCFSKFIKTLRIFLTLPQLLFSSKAKDILSSLAVYGVLPSSGIWLLFFFKTFIWYSTLSAVHRGFSLVSYLVLCVSVSCFSK